MGKCRDKYLLKHKMQWQVNSGNKHQPVTWIHRNKYESGEPIQTYPPITVQTTNRISMSQKNPYKVTISLSFIPRNINTMSKKQMACGGSRKHTDLNGDSWLCGAISPQCQHVMWTKCAILLTALPPLPIVCLAALAATNGPSELVLYTLEVLTCEMNAWQVLFSNSLSFLQIVTWQWIVDCATALTIHCTIVKTTLCSISSAVEKRLALFDGRWYGQ